MNTNRSVTANFTIRSYTINASAGTGGTITPPGATSVNYGASRTYAIAATAGYTLSSVIVDGVSVGAVTSYTFSNVTAVHTITAAFTVNTNSPPAGYTYCSAENGICSFSGTRNVAYGANGVFAYRMATNTINCNNSTFGDPIPGTVKACYFGQTAITTYTISASAGTGGLISPSGSTSVTSGGSQTYTITPNTGYSVASVTVDGTSVSAVTSYTFSNVTANHTIAATFTPVISSYTLTVTTSGTGSGSVTTSPTGTSFTAGTVVTLTATANASSTFTGWSGACSGTAATCQVTMNANKSVSANFTIRSYTINASISRRGGTISPSGNVSVAFGSNKTFTITPQSGYKIWFVVIDNQNYGALTSYTFTNVKEKHTIKAYFTR